MTSLEKQVPPVAFQILLNTMQLDAVYPIGAEVPHQLTWTHFVEMLNTEGDNPPVGIVLTKEKDDLLIKYAMHNLTSQLFISKYQFYMPDKEELRQLIEKQLLIEGEK
ncbi:MAG: PDDEXK nuclease domain-containing protein [Bacteroidota bacterium]